MRSIYDAVPAPFAHYRMNDNLATAAVIDATGTYAGTYKSVGGNANTADHDVPGKLNNALDFVGDDDYVEIADAAAFSPISTPFSISLWVYMHSASNFQFVSKGVVGADNEWRLYTNVPCYLYFSLYDHSATAYIGRYYGTALSANTWLHIVATYDGGILSSGVKLYLNGVQVDAADAKVGTFAAVENLTHAIWIGRYSTAYANGVFDNVMFFDKELTALQALKLYDYKKGQESIFAPRPNRIYSTSLIRNSIYGV